MIPIESGTYVREVSNLGGHIVDGISGCRGRCFSVIVNDGGSARVYSGRASRTNVRLAGFVRGGGALRNLPGTMIVPLLLIRGVDE